MKSSLRLIILCGALSWGSCSFDRAPVLPPAAAGRGGAPASTQAPGAGAPSVTPRDAGTPDAQLQAADAAPTGSVSLADAASPTDASLDAADSDSGTLEPESLRCSDVFCPLASGPARACCTTDGDVSQRAARGADQCGLDLSALAASGYGSSCWQRDQLGIIDDRCPPVEGEPGCCADDGTCGSHDALQPLGCRHLPGTPARACGDKQPAGSCDPVGSYGFRVTIDATWSGRGNGLLALTDDGRGPIQIYFLANIDSVDSKTQQISANGRVCGITLPPFRSTTLCETYQPVFPETIWESPSLPRPVIDGHYTCGTQGCVLSLGPTTYVFGIHLDNPEASWPTPAQTPSLRCSGQPNDQCFPDDDEDGQPGVGIRLSTSEPAAPSGAGGAAGSGGNSGPGGGNSGPGGGNNRGPCTNGYDLSAAPLSASAAAIFDGVRRSDRLMLGIRARVGGSIRFGDDCQTARGSALAQYVNSRAKGCMVEPGTFDVLQSALRPAGQNDLCTASEAKFIDESMPEYRVLAPGETPEESETRTDNAPSAGPVVSVVRFAASPMPITCEEVRKAMY